jgi:hypothetical protein
METTGITVDKFGNHRCAECERFTNRPGIVAIKHANYCDSKAQPAAAPVAATGPSLKIKVTAGREAIRNGGVSAVLSDDEIVEAVRSKFMSVDDAMNRDF